MSVEVGGSKNVLLISLREEFDHAADPRRAEIARILGEMMQGASFKGALKEEDKRGRKLPKLDSDDEEDW